MPTSKVSVGDFISYSLRNQETTGKNLVSSVTPAFVNTNQNRTVTSTIVSSAETMVVYEHFINLLYKDGQGKSYWVVGEQ